MDPEILELLDRLNKAYNGDASVTPLTDDELRQVETALRAVSEGIDPRQATQDDLDAMADAVAALDVVEAELAVRTEAQETRATQAEELLGRLRPVTDAEGAAGGPEGGEDEGGETEGGEGETEGAAGEAEALAAGGTPARRPLPTMDRLARRRPRRAAPAETQTARTQTAAVLTAAADMPGMSAGVEVDVERWALGVEKRIEAVRKVTVPGADGEKVYLGTIRTDYPEDRRLVDGNPTRNRQIVEGVVGREALAASGGICGPVAVDYSINTLAAADRPVKQSLAQFQATRGGVRYILPHTLAQVTADAPAAIWTQGTDANPGASTKPHATFLCQAVQEAYVDAVTSIVQFGNFQARYFPEQITQYMETADAVHSRLAEATLLAAISAGSSQVTADNYEVGAARDLLHTLDRVYAGYVYRHRIADGTKLRIILPRYVKDMVRADLALNMPGDSGGSSERLAVADAEIERFIAARNFNVTWALDSPSGLNPLQGFGAQGNGQLLPWPTTTYGWVFHEGAWMFLDGGELNLGMVRDSVLNKTNDFQMFTETFEKAIFRGHESEQVAFKIAPTGASVGTVAPVSGGTETIGS